MLLVEFLTLFVCRMNEDDIRHCVLRNYEGLPKINIGNDIDVLIQKKHERAVIRILANMEPLIITAVTKRYCVTSIFICGVHWGGSRKFIQIDLITSLSWKGLSYLDSKSIFDCMSVVPSSSGLLNRPALHHEAVNSFFSSYLVGGWIKDKYQQNVQEIFSNNEAKVLQLLQSFLSQKLSMSLLNAVISDDRNAILALLPKVRSQLIINQLRKNPIKAFLTVIEYYINEIKIRFTQYPITSICFLGVDGSGKSSVISALTEKLDGAVKEISCTHLKPGLKKVHSKTHAAVDDPHGMPPRTALVSIAKLTWWLILYWYDNFFHKHRNSTLRIWDRYYYDVYIDPKRYRYGAPLWVAKLLGKLIPRPGLVFVLDAPAETIQARKQEVSVDETQRQREEYLRFAKEMPSTIVLNTKQSLELTESDCVEAVLKYMQEKQKLRIGMNGVK